MSSKETVVLMLESGEIAEAYIKHGRRGTQTMLKCSVEPEGPEYQRFIQMITHYVNAPLVSEQWGRTPQEAIAKTDFSLGPDGRKKQSPPPEPGREEGNI